MAVKDKKYLGQRLLQRGFRVWFLYMFRVIEGHDFIEEEIHADLFKEFEDLHKQIILRSSISVPPRSGKTTFAKYFLAFIWSQMPASNFIYTSYSQSLLGDISRELVGLLEHPVYKAMYNLNFSIEEETVDPIDEFWKEYLINNEGKAQYSSKKLVSPSGGVILFSSVGSSITGFGAGVRGADGFSGALIIDDANKPADIHSPVMRKKVTTYYDETLLSRLNNSNVAIINIQQRLHVKDLTAYLAEQYDFRLLKKPLIVDGVCQLPKQYNETRIKELQVNNYMFKAQYQQEPIALGGNIFKDEWWKYYIGEMQYEYRVIVADTAMKTKTHNDYSVMQCWGVKDGQGYLIDQIRGKWESHELEVQAVAFWNKHKTFGHGKLRCFGIEDKASGTGLIQGLKAKHKIPVHEIKADKDKLTRAMDAVPYIANGFVYLPQNAPFLSDYLTELSSFTADDSHDHDDQVDPTVYFINEFLSGKAKRKVVGKVKLSGF